MIDHETGMLVEPKQPEQLADAIKTLMQQPVLRAAMGERARQRVLEFFSWSRIAQQTAAMYEHAERRAA